jgi:hypothetical protein
MKVKKWNDFIFEIASNDEVYQDIDELRQAFDEIVGDEFNIYEVPKNNPLPPDLMTGFFKKGIYYQFTFESNRIKLYIYYKIDNDSELRNVCKTLFESGMIPFYRYLDGNGFKYANADMRFTEYKFKGSDFYFNRSIMSIWQADY